MYSNAAAVLRPDVNTFVEESAIDPQLFIGGMVLPEFSSPSGKTGQYPIFRAGLSELLNNDAALRARGDSYPRVVRAYDADNFTCEDRGLEEGIDDTDNKDLSRFFNVEVETARRVLQQVRIGHEIRVAAKINDTATFSSAAAAVAYTQANIATIDLPQDVENAKDQLALNGQYANSIVMSAQVYNRVSRSTLLQNYIRGNRPTDSTKRLSPQEIADAFLLQNCFIGRVAYNTAKKGKAASTSFVWGNTYIWVGVVGAGMFENGGAGRTIVWSEDASSMFVTETYRDEEVRSDIIRVRQNTSEKISNAKAGYLITTSYS